MSQRKYKVYCIGDSNTKGQFAYDWVKYLSKKLNNYDFVKEAENGDLAYNATKRVKRVLEGKPDYVLILLGSNDIYSTLSEKLTNEYIKEKALPVKPNKFWFSENIEKIIHEISTKCKAKIAVISIPIMGEDMGFYTNDLVKDYNSEIKKIAKTYKIAYLPFSEEMMNYLSKFENHKEKVPFIFSWKIKLKVAFMRFLLFKTWNSISSSNNLELLTDSLHLNQRSGLLLIALIEDFISARDHNMHHSVMK